jgi:hypothetical protein
MKTSVDSGVLTGLWIQPAPGLILMRTNHYFPGEILCMNCLKKAANAQQNKRYDVKRNAELEDHRRLLNASKQAPSRKKNDAELNISRCPAVATGNHLTNTLEQETAFECPES